MTTEQCSVYFFETPHLTFDSRYLMYFVVMSGLSVQIIKPLISAEIQASSGHRRSISRPEQAVCHENGLLRSIKQDIVDSLVKTEPQISVKIEKHAEYGIVLKA